MKYVPPYGASDPNAPYINGNPQTGTPGSIPAAAAIEHPLREIHHAITAAGLIPNPADLTQLAQAIAKAGEDNNVVRIVATANGLKGGGPLDQDRTLSLDIAGLPEKETASDDFLAIWDPVAQSYFKISRDTFIQGLGGSGGTVTGGANIGTGTGLVFDSLASGNLRFRKIKNAGGLTIAVTGDDVTLAFADMPAALTID